MNIEVPINFGYHAIEDEYRDIYTIPSKQELIDKYFNK